MHPDTRKCFPVQSLQTVLESVSRRYLVLFFLVRCFGIWSPIQLEDCLVYMFARAEERLLESILYQRPPQTYMVVQHNGASHLAGKYFPLIHASFQATYLLRPTNLLASLPTYQPTYQAAELPTKQPTNPLVLSYLSWGAWLG